MMNPTEKCPCGSGAAFEKCCGPYLSGKKQAPTVEALMRSRYSAYACCNVDYLYNTSCDEVRKDFDAENTKRWAETSTWTGLEVVRVEEGTAKDLSGVVEFIAHYSVDESVFNHHEIASFVKGPEGNWVFADGKIIGPEPVRREAPRIGRNDPCPCGSGKKYKKCCG